MKKQELRYLIREEIKRVIKEATPTFADRKATAIYNIILVATKDKKLNQLQKEFDKYSIDLPLQDLEQVKSALMRSNWDAIDWSDIKTIQQALDKVSEATLNNFTPSQRMASLPRPFAELLPTTAKTIAEATERINQFKGKNIAMHARYFVVKPKEGTTVALFEDSLLYFGQSEYHMPIMRGMQEQVKVNVTELTIRDITDVPQGQSWTAHKDKVVELGRAYVNTDVFLKECQELFTIVKQGS